MEAAVYIALGTSLALNVFQVLLARRAKVPLPPVGVSAFGVEVRAPDERCVVARGEDFTFPQSRKGWAPAVDPKKIDATEEEHEAFNAEVEEAFTPPKVTRG